MYSENRKAKFNYFENKEQENLFIFHFGTENSMLTEEDRMFIIPNTQKNTFSTELSHLETNVQSQVQNIVKEYSTLWAAHKFQIGCFNSFQVKARLDTTRGISCRQAPRLRFLPQL